MSISIILLNILYPCFSILKGLFEEVKQPTMDAAESVYNLAIPPSGLLTAPPTSSRHTSQSPNRGTKSRPSGGGREATADDSEKEKCSIS